MSGLQPVTISLATYKAIEAQRLSFGESHDAIIRRALSERTSRRRMAGERAAPPIGRTRRRGDAKVRLFGQLQPVLNLKDAYLVSLTALVRHRASLFQLLAAEGTARRRWVAASADALFSTSPHLADQHAHQIAPNWFIDTNVSRAQIMARLEVACRLAGCRFGDDVAIIER